MKFMALPLAALIGLGGSIIGSVAGAASQASANSKNIALAKMQNQWNIEQWQRENVYNTPAAQMARLKSAGINPNLAYANGGLQNLAASSPTMTSGKGVESVLSGQNLPSMGEITSAVAQAEMLDAQKENVQADTAQKNAAAAQSSAQTDILRSDAAFRDAFNQNVLDLQDTQIKLNDASFHLTETQSKKLRAETNKIAQETKNLTAEYDKIKAATANMDANTYKTKVDAYLNQASTRAQIKLMAAQTGLTREQANDIVRTQLYRINNLQAENSHIQAQNMLIGVQSDKLTFDLQSDMAFKNYERAFNLVEGVVSTSANTIQGFIPFLKGSK